MRLEILVASGIDFIHWDGFLGWISGGFAAVPERILTITLGIRALQPAREARRAKINDLVSPESRIVGIFLAK